MLRSLFAFLIILFMMKGQKIQSQPLYNKMVLEEMVSFNEKMKTDRLMVSVGDSLIADVTYRGRRNDRYLVYSITKVFSGIAVGIMIDQQLISSAEVPVSTFFPDWGQDSLKKMITIRHILQHSSGLESGTGSRDIYPQPDYVQFALNSAVISTPGLRFFYNNKAINIISGIVNKATGKSLEDFIREHVFRPLDIEDYEWKKDQAGNTWGMDGLWIRAADLMKIGRMLSNYGIWNGRRILSRQWCELMFQLPLSNAMNGIGGYAMSIRPFFFNEQIEIDAHAIENLKKAGMEARFTDKLAAVQQKGSFKYLQLGEVLKQTFTLEEMEEIIAFSTARNIPLYKVVNGNFVVMHGGEYGLILALYPSKKTVVVRYLGERWGRQQKEDGTEYKYLIDKEIIVHMIRLTSELQ